RRCGRALRESIHVVRQTPRRSNSRAVDAARYPAAAASPPQTPEARPACATQQVAPLPATARSQDLLRESATCLGLCALKRPTQDTALAVCPAASPFLAIAGFAPPPHPLLARHCPPFSSCG